MNIAKIKRIKLITSLVFVFIMMIVFTLLFIDISNPFMKMIKTGEYIHLELYFQKFGFWGPLFISLSQSMQIVLAVIPCEPVQVLAGLSYGPYIGFVASLSGLMLGNFIIYLLVRKLGSNFVLLFKSKDIINVTTVSKGADSKRIGWVILILYWLPAIPCGLIAFLATSTKMKFHKYMIITTLGVTPSVVASLYVGELLKTGNFEFTIILACLMVILGVVSAIFHNKIFNFLLKGGKNESNGEVQE
jgi:uncharacterized membrane protein YdjX (TVP38/TMEM64 family)